MERVDSSCLINASKNEYSMGFITQPGNSETSELLSGFLWK